MHGSKITWATLKINQAALAGVAQYTERWSANLKVAGSIPSQGTCLGFGPGPQLEVWERQPIDVSLTHRCVSPSLSPSLPLPLQIIKYFEKYINKTSFK